MIKFIIGYVIGVFTVTLVFHLPKMDIDLPEEYMAISHDSTHKDLMTAYYRGDRLILGFYYDPKDHDDNRIIKQTIDERGLYSVVFIQDGKEWGLDYITSEQLDSLINELNK